MDANRTRCSGITRLTKRALAAVIAMTFVLSGGFFGPVPVRAEAATYTWTGGAGTSDWHTAGNWPVGGSMAEQGPGDGEYSHYWRGVSC